MGLNGRGTTLRRQRVSRPTPQIQRNIVARSMYTDTNKQDVACTDRACLNRSMSCLPEQCYLFTVDSHFLSLNYVYQSKP